jgi:hypothetical protein
MIVAELVLGGLNSGLDRPSEPGDAGQFGEVRGVKSGNAFN